MIRVTRLDGSPIIVNVDLVQWIERTPDTVLSLVSGEKLPVREAPEEIVSKVIEFKRALRLRARPAAAPGEARPAGAVAAPAGGRA
ncbi:MAG: flagellar protein FlbD [Acidobacteria bacterium]|nr:MAG: flagellar protein FlbD [Acidobacteriota bacterium]RPJ73542.1 MAG: flagellar protein FlbD [Acidobacteriota bacterium]